MADVSLDFPPPSYSSLFFPTLLKAVGEKGVDLSEIFKSKKGEKKKLGKKWRSTAKYVLGDWRKKDGSDGKNNTSNKLETQVSIEDLDPNDMTLLQLLALNALDLTAPASDVLLKNRKNNWVQLSGHEGAFAPAGPGTIWKKRTCQDDTEVKAYTHLMKDIMCDLVPHFYKEVEWNGDHYIEMQDLLHDFKDPLVMDIKMGTRTFAESEVTNQKARQDLYQKMVKLDPNAPTDEEHSMQAVTKMRYMSFREQQSSSSTLGFRIEAMKLEDSEPVKDLKLVRTRTEVLHTMNQFLAGHEQYRIQLLDRFRTMRGKLERSEFFKRHEIVGSSILIVLDQTHAGAWMIDFAKTFSVPDSMAITHQSQWTYGNREDGYLLGLDSLIQVLEDVDCSAVITQKKNIGAQNAFLAAYPSTSTNGYSSSSSSSSSVWHGFKSDL